MLSFNFFFDSYLAITKKNIKFYKNVLKFHFTVDKTTKMWIMLEYFWVIFEPSKFVFHLAQYKHALLRHGRNGAGSLYFIFLSTKRKRARGKKTKCKVLARRMKNIIFHIYSIKKHFSSIVFSTFFGLLKFTVYHGADGKVAKSWEEERK